MDSMSFMIEELVTNITYVGRSWLRCYPPKNALARSRYKTRDNQQQRWGNYKKPHGSHMSKGESLFLSIPYRWALRGTTYLSLCDGLHMQCCG